METENRKTAHARRGFVLKKTLALLLILAVTAASGNVSWLEIKAAGAGGQYILPVFETSDVHGYLAETNGENNQYRLAYISDKVKDARNYNSVYDKNAALLLDAGDIFQGSTLSNLLHGNPVSCAYALMDYDVVTVGNHEFDWGIENVIDGDGTMRDCAMEGFETENKVPVVVSNLYLNNVKTAWMQDYVIVTKTARNADGAAIPVRIAVIGYVDNYEHEIMESKFIGLGYSIDENADIPNAIAKELEESGKADATVLLCHADAQETAESLGENSAIDVVLGGHSHNSKNGTASNGIPYMEPENYGEEFCRLNLVFEKEGDNAAFTSVTGTQIVSLADWVEKTWKTDENAQELDNSIVLLTDAAIDRLQDVMNAKIGYITTSAKKKGYIEGSGNLSTTGGNWMSSVYARAVNSDVAFTNHGGVRYNFELPEGQTQRDVTLAEIYANYPFGNFLYKYSLTYEELLEVFTYGLKDPEHRAITSVIGIDCYFENNEVQALVKDGTPIYLNGEWKDGWRTKTLTVATSDYVGTSDDIFDGMHNPLKQFNNAQKLLEKDLLDIDGAITVLTKEAAENNGLLTIDTTPHFMEGAYQGAFPETETPDEPADPTPPDTPTTPEQPSGGKLLRLLRVIVDFLVDLILRLLACPAGI